MLILSPLRDTSAAGHAVAIFGVGLVGKSIVSSLHDKTAMDSTCLPLAWTRSKNRAAQIEAIRRELVSCVDKPDAIDKRISIVWSAGAAGFSSPQAVLDVEIESLQLVVELCKTLRASRSDIEIDFHLLSSAGGLFEGQRNVDADTVPAPKRAYAMTKLMQERIAGALSEDIKVHIYRPSSIYGYHRDGRPGLIITLIHNGYQRRTTSIFGSLDTMRDFIHVSDIGRFVSERVCAPGPSGGKFLLARGKPNSMRSVLLNVEEVIGQRLYLKFDPRPSNAQHNTYAPSATQHMRNAIPLAYGVKLSALQWFENEFGRKSA